MGKNPAFQFYPGDWTRDLDDYPLEIEGAWIRICCRLWWSETPGCLIKTLKEWARILRKTEKKTEKILHFLIEKHIAGGHNLDNQNITISSRRMMEDDRIRKIRQEVGKLGGNPQLKRIKKNLVNQTDNQKPTPSSSSSSSSSNSKDKEEDVLVSKKKHKTSYPADNEFIISLKDLYLYVDINQELNKMKAWLMTPKGRGRQLNRRFIVNWLNKLEKPISTGEVQPINEQDRKSWEIKKALDKIKWKEDGKNEHPEPT